MKTNNKPLDEASSGTTVSQDGNKVTISIEKSPRVGGEELKRAILEVLESSSDRFTKQIYDTLQQELKYERNERDKLQKRTPLMFTCIGFLCGGVITLLIGHFKLQREYFELRLEKQGNEILSKIQKSKPSSVK